MSEGTHSTTQSRRPRSKRVVAVVAGGALAAAATAALAFQFFRSKDAVTAEAGAARVNGAEQRSPGDRKALANVNNQVIDYEAVAKECVHRHGKEVLESMINRTIIEQACRKEGIKVTRAEVEGEVINIARKFNLEPANWYQMLQAERNMTPDQYQRDIIWPMIALRKLANENITISEQELVRTFKRDYGPRVKAKMIMVDNFRRAQDIWKQASQQPDNFGRLARQHSVEPNSQALDGQIPPIRMYVGNENLWKSAFKLREGEVSGIVEVGTPASRRWVILQCEGRTETLVKSLDEKGIREIIHSQLQEEKVQQTVARVFEDLKKNAVVTNYMTGYKSGGFSQASAAQPQRRRGGSPAPGGPRTASDVRKTSFQR